MRIKKGNGTYVEKEYLIPVPFSLELSAEDKSRA